MLSSDSNDKLLFFNRIPVIVSRKQIQMQNILIETKNKKRIPLILDGAIGSLLQQSGLSQDPVLWSSTANIQVPEEVIDIHKKYIEAGADIITTNTFRTNPASIKKSGLQINLESFVKAGVDRAKEAVENQDVIIAGSNPPAEDSYQKERTLSQRELIDNHHKHIELLWENGCDIILNESQSHLDEIKIICEYSASKNIEWMISVFFTDDFKILSGEYLTEVLDLIIDYKPSAIGLNCIRPETAVSFLNNYSLNYPWGIYLNCGSGNFNDKEISCGVSPAQYLEYIKKIINDDLLFIGSCCGSGPEHTRILRNYFDQKNKY